jgi:HK97 family phage portal protein
MSEVDGFPKPEVTGPPIEKAYTTNVAPDPTGVVGLAPDYLSFRNTWFGQPQPVAYKMLWKAYLEDPIVRSCVNITVEAIMGDGYLLEGKTELHVKRVKNSFKEMFFQKFLQDVVTSLTIYGDAYAELVRDGGGGLLKTARPLDAATIRIDYDEHGTVLKFIQRVLHRRVDFYPDEMAHFSINNIGGRPYGTSDLQAILNTIQAKQAAQSYNTEYFRRPGLPRVIYISKNISEPQNKRIVETLKTVTPQSDLYFNVQNGELDVKEVAPSNTDMQFVELMEFLRSEMIAAMAVPPIFLGITEGSNRSNAQTQLEAWDRRKKKLRLVIQDLINTQLLTVANFGFDDVVFKFKDSNSREELKYGQLMQLLSTVKWMRPNEIRAAAGLPPISELKIIYDSEKDAINMSGDDIGDRLLYDIEKEDQQAQMEQEAAMDPLQNPNAAHPMRNQKKEDNKERLNSAQGNETRKLAKADPRKDYPFGAVEPEKEVLDPNAWEQMRVRLAMIVETQLRNTKNQNYEFDEPDKPTTSRAAPKDPPPARGDKAVFYSEGCQLDEIKKS